MRHSCGSAAAQRHRQALTSTSIVPFRWYVHLSIHLAYHITVSEHTGRISFVCVAGLARDTCQVLSVFLEISYHWLDPHAGAFTTYRSFTHLIWNNAEQKHYIYVVREDCFTNNNIWFYLISLSQCHFQVPCEIVAFAFLDPKPLFSIWLRWNKIFQTENIAYTTARKRKIRWNWPTRERRS